MRMLWQEYLHVYGSTLSSKQEQVNHRARAVTRPLAEGVLGGGRGGWRRGRCFVWECSGANDHNENPGDYCWGWWGRGGVRVSKVFRVASFVLTVSYIGVQVAGGGWLCGKPQL